MHTAAAYGEGEVAKWNQKMWRSSAAGPGHRGGVWVVVGVAAVAVLAWHVVARTGPHHAAASSPTPAAAAGPQWWPSPPSRCGPAGDLWLPTGSPGSTVRLWNPVTGRPAGAPIHASAENGVSAVAFSPDSTLLASASGDGTVQLWNPATGRPVGAPLQAGSGHGPLPEGPDHGRLVAVFSPGGALIASCWSASPTVARP